MIAVDAWNLMSELLAVSLPAIWIVISLVNVNGITYPGNVVDPGELAEPLPGSAPVAGIEIDSGPGVTPAVTSGALPGLYQLWKPCESPCSVLL